MAGTPRPASEQAEDGGEMRRRYREKLSASGGSGASEVGWSIGELTEGRRAARALIAVDI